MHDPVAVSAPAKVNLFLGVGPRRADGYHDVTTIVAALEFADSVVVSPADALTLTRDPEPGFPATSDLSWRAATSLAEALDRAPSLAIELVKRIPVAAGLGGGSSDAAAVLVGACALWGVPVDDERVLSTAASLGADVPFFLHGGCGRYEGRGDVLAASLPAPSLDLVLVNPGVPAPTSAVYAAFDAAPPPERGDTAALEAALETGSAQAIAAHLVNDLAQAAQAVAPEVTRVLAWLEARDDVSAALVAGSGATVFAVTRDAAAARAVEHAARRSGWWSQATRTSRLGAAANTLS